MTTCNINQFRQTCVLPPGPTADQMSQYMSQTFPQGGGILVPGQNVDPDDPRLVDQSTIWAYCSQNDSAFGGVCRDGLAAACQVYTKQDTVNKYIRQLCGCYLPDSEYDPDAGRNCDSACIQQDVVKYFETPTSLPSICTTGVCVIDQVTLQITGSSTGNINFYQACPSCGPTPCRCIINDVNILVTDSRTGSLNIQQNCPGGTVCYSSAPDGTQVQVDCTPYFQSFGLNSSTLEQEQNRSIRVFYLSLITAIILLFILIGGIIISFYQQRKIIINRVDVTNFERETGPKVLL